MKRYLLCPVIGDGSIESPYRPKMPRGVSYTCIIPSNADGSPRFPWCLVHASADDLSDVTKDADLEPLPNVGIDSRLSLTASQKNALASRLTARGISAEQAAVLADGTLRQLIRAIGRRLDKDFDETRWGVK